MAVMSRATRWVAVVALVVNGLLGGCTSAQPLALLDPLPRPAPTPTPTPTPTRPPDLPPPPPFQVVVEHIETVSADNHEILGVPPEPPDLTVVEASVRDAADALARYLTTQFGTKTTAFGETGVADLLVPGAPAALDADGRLALGMLSRDDLLGTRAPQAVARALVVADGARVMSVTLDFRASFELVLVDAAGPVTQTGTLGMVPRHDGWRAADVVTEIRYGGELAAVLS